MLDEVEHVQELPYVENSMDNKIDKDKAEKEEKIMDVQVRIDNLKAQWIKVS